MATSNSARTSNASLNLSRRSFLGLLGFSSLTLGLTACGGGSASGTDASAGSASAASASVTKITIGTEGTMAPFTYFDDNNNLTGFDIELARAIDQKLDDYEFDFQTIEWSSMFASLDADKIQTIANQVATNEERKKKYLFEDTPYLYSAGAIVFKKGRTDIKSLEDLKGKTIDAGTTAYNTAWLEDYNSKNGNSITFNYTDGDVNKAFQDIVNGRADATITTPVAVETAIEKQGIDVDWIVLSEKDPVPIYFPFQNSDAGKKLRDAFEGAIQDLLADGTISELSKKFLGADYSTKEAVAQIAQEKLAGK